LAEQNKHALSFNLLCNATIEPTNCQQKAELY